MGTSTDSTIAATRLALTPSQRRVINSCRTSAASMRAERSSSPPTAPRDSFRTPSTGSPIKPTRRLPGAKPMAGCDPNNHLPRRPGEVLNWVLAALFVIGCNGPTSSPTKSPTVAGDSPEFRKAAENAERIAKEQQQAERKALGGKRVE